MVEAAKLNGAGKMAEEAARQEAEEASSEADDAFAWASHVWSKRSARKIE